MSAVDKTPPIVSPTPQRAPQNTCPILEQSVSPDNRLASEDDDNTLTESELSSFEIASDDDEAGVFFGAHNPIERKIVATLSRSIPPSPASHNLSTIAGRRRSSLVNCVNARGSREFVRRKTLVHGDLEKAINSLEKGVDGEVLDRPSVQEETEEDAVMLSEEPVAGPSSEPMVSASANVVHESPDVTPDDMPSFNAEEHMFRNIPMSDEETDKENTMLPDLYYGSEEDDYMMTGEPEPETAVTLGFANKEGDVATQIDMGGLSMLDLDDPDLGPLEDTSITCDTLDLDSSDLSSAGAPSVLENPFLGNSTSASSNFSVALDDPFFIHPQWTPDKAPDVPRPAVSSEASPQPRSVSTPVKGTPLRQTFPQTPSEIAADKSYDSELNSPIVARGPMVMPVFSVASPTASTVTPMRGLEPGPPADLALPGATPEIALALPSLDSPTSRILPVITPRRLAPSMAPLPKTPASVRPNRTPMVSCSERPNRVLKASQIQNSVDADRARRRAEKKAAAIRGQLDWIVSSKMSSFSPAKNVLSPAKSPGMAKSPRVIAGSNSQPLAASVNKVTPPEARPQRPDDAVSAPARVERSHHAATGPAGKPLKSALKNPIKPATSGIPVPRKAATVTGIPRPVGKRPTAMTVHRATKVAPIPPLAASVVEPLQELVTPTPINGPQATPVPSLKRPFSAIQSVDRPTVAVGGRSFAPRNIRDTGLQASLGLGPAPPAFRSPSRASVMGKPVRPMATPTSQRMGRVAPSPARPASTPLKSHPVRPSPASAQPLSAQKPPSAQKMRTPLGPATRPFTTSLMPRLSEARSEPAEDVEDARAVPPQKEDEKMEVDEKAAEETSAPAGATKESRNETESVTCKDSGNPSNGAASSSASAGPARIANGNTTNSISSIPTKAPIPAPAPVPPREQQETARPDPASPTPESGRGARRSTRTRAPPPPIVAPTAQRAKPTPVPSIVPNMSEKELKSATTRNTMRNQVYLCAIDRQIVRVPGPRPPSPTSKITKTAEREEEEKKAERNARARRRQRSSSVSEDDQPLVEQVQLTVGPGDDEEYSTPVRPAKRARLSGSDNGEDNGGDKFVRWNRSLTVIRGGIGSEPTAAPVRPAARSALKSDAQIPLDAHGNVVDRPVEKLKRTKVTVQAMFYDGEEPVPFNYNARPKRGKK